MKLVQENYKSTGSVEPKKKPDEWHYSKLVKTKAKPGMHGAMFNNRDQSRDAGKHF